MKGFIYLLFLILLLSAGNSSAQRKSPTNFPPGVSFQATSQSDTGKEHFRFATLPLNYKGSPVVKRTNDNTCRTTTFYLRIPSASGQTTQLADLETLPGGDYMLAGTIVAGGNARKGLLMRLTNAGVIIQQKQLTVNNYGASIANIKVNIDGTMFISGIVDDSNHSVFVAQLNNDLTPVWVKIFVMPGLPQTIFTDVMDDDNITMAVHFNGSIIYALLDPAGNIKWQQQIIPDGLVELVGFTNLNWSQVGLVYNTIRGGKRIAELVEADKNDGHIISTNVKGDGVAENKALAAGSFNVRLNMVTVNKVSGTDFRVHRDILYSSSLVETNHNYPANNNIDFNASAAMDNAGDIIGVSIPSMGKLMLTRHYAYYQTSAVFTREYNIGQDASIRAIARSFDGGILCGVNSKDLKEMILIKTDSLGILPGCENTVVSNQSAETRLVPNAPSALLSGNSNIINATATTNVQDINLSTVFNCQQTYCPPAAEPDTCLTTYYKTLRSNSHADIVYYSFLMRNNNYLTTTARYDRVIGGNNIVTAGLKLFDEGGNFIKGANIFMEGVSALSWARRMDDKSIMLVLNSSKNNIASSTFVLVSDDLNIIWTTSLRGSASFTGNAADEADIHKDEEGNYYIVGPTRGYLGEKPTNSICKLNAAGHVVWAKKYAMDKGLFGISTVTSSASSLYIITAGAGDGSASVRIDKNSGALLNSYNFRTTFLGGIFRRQAKFEKGKLLYVGAVGKDDLFAMMVFDSTAKPVKMRSITNSGSLRGASIQDGKIYATYVYYNGLSPREVILKADSDLNVEFFKEYNNDSYRYAKSLDVSPEGNIYVTGNILMIDEAYSYFIKYDENGNRGTCNALNTSPVINDLDPLANTLGYSNIPVTVEEFDVPVELVPDIYGQQIGNILCKSMPLCTSLKVSGPDTVCILNQGYKYVINKSVECTIQPQWLADTALVHIEPIADTAATIQFKRPGMIEIEVTLNGGCNTLRDKIVTNVQRSAANLNLGADKAICAEDSIILRAGDGFSSYRWQDGSTDSVFVVKNPGLYTINATNACADQAADSILISEALVPSLSFGNDTVVCKGVSLQVHASAGFKNYYWFNAPDIPTPNTSITIDVNQSQVVSVKAVTNEGCFAADTILVDTKEARPVFLGNDTSFCAPHAITLSAGTSYTAYTWNNGVTASAITANQPGVYWVKATDINGCIATDTLVINEVYAQPKPILGNDFDLCNGNVQQLDAGLYASYQWMDNAQGRYYTAAVPGKYWVLVTDQHQCTGSDTIEIKNILPIPSNFLPAADSICQYEELKLRATGSYQSYLWSNGSQQSETTITEPGIYLLSVKDMAGCTGTDTIAVFRKNCMSGLYVPNAFTPNGDQRNDVFRAMAYGKVVSFRFEVYDRFGQLVFQTTDPRVGWDGSVNGKTKPSGVFAWQCFCQFEGGGPVHKKGTVTLIR